MPKPSRRTTRHTLVAPRLATFDLLAVPPTPIAAPESGRGGKATSAPDTVTLEYSVHRCSSRFYHELCLTFPHLRSPHSSEHQPWSASLTNTSGSLPCDNPLLVVPTFQHTSQSLVAIGPGVEDEKNEKLLYFFAWGNTVIAHLRKRGYWADMTDPCSGYPIHSPRGPSFYPDIAGCQYLLKYSVMTTNSCCVMVHPRWGTNFYPATLFTMAPAKVLESVLTAMTIRVQSHN
ncbi:hypothetical protein H4R35_006089 [Dimargaris xerosporica]|nr:hypothetical protein H4R35_006089 [Dimargaris xerosporica]